MTKTTVDLEDLFLWKKFNSGFLGLSAQVTPSKKLGVEYVTI